MTGKRLGARWRRPEKLKQVRAEVFRGKQPPNPADAARLEQIKARKIAKAIAAAKAARAAESAAEKAKRVLAGQKSLQSLRKEIRANGKPRLTIKPNRAQKDRRFSV